MRKTKTSNRKRLTKKNKKQSILFRECDAPRTDASNLKIARVRAFGRCAISVKPLYRLHVFLTQSRRDAKDRKATINESAVVKHPQRTTNFTSLRISASLRLCVRLITGFTDNAILFHVANG